MGKGKARSVQEVNLCVFQIHGYCFTFTLNASTAIVLFTGTFAGNTDVFPIVAEIMHALDQWVTSWLFCDLCGAWQDNNRRDYASTIAAGRDALTQRIELG
ncbi:hypothetical protein NEOLEDRAFT_1126725 [Neolentinus lepideus HHB14362 ss-1]|uniref:Uncharacterized protein n=1 Tax=Neolentinus lepideus HHB14362 ss-1 TaxID=1314782 RepID=A0A165VPZ6_9AGAM|nr:hypothetical protein NEOLEDRAFT_1126725 [Neolentinus lepideus HHB14362 ss-1]